MWQAWLQLRDAGIMSWAWEAGARLSALPALLLPWLGPEPGPVAPPRTPLTSVCRTQGPFPTVLGAGVFPLSPSAQTSAPQGSTGEWAHETEPACSARPPCVPVVAVPPLRLPPIPPATVLGLLDSTDASRSQARMEPLRQLSELRTEWRPEGTRRDSEVTSPLGAIVSPSVKWVCSSAAPLRSAEEGLAGAAMRAGFGTRCSQGGVLVPCPAEQVAGGLGGGRGVPVVPASEHQPHPVQLVLRQPHHRFLCLVSASMSESLGRCLVGGGGAGSLRTSIGHPLCLYSGPALPRACLAPPGVCSLICGVQSPGRSLEARLRTRRH